MRSRYLATLWLLFGLTAAAGTPFPGECNSGTYRVLVMGDAHFDAEEFHEMSSSVGNHVSEHERNLKMWQAKSPALFAAAGKRAVAESVAFAVQLGDLVQGDYDGAALQQAMIRKGFAEVKKNFPRTALLIVKGNHDIRTAKRSRNNTAANPALLPIISRELGKPVKRNSCYAFTRGRDLYIAVDGFIAAGAIENFVRETLAACPDTRYVFFMTHLPLLPAAIGRPFWVVPGHDRIVKLLEKRNTLILAAHTHSPSLGSRTTKQGRLTQLIVSSMGHSWGMKLKPEGCRSWKSYAAAVEKRFAAREAKKNTDVRKRWEAWKHSGTFTFRHLFGNSGFVVLEIDDEKVVARYYIDSSAKPGVKLKLLTAR